MTSIICIMYVILGYIYYAKTYYMLSYIHLENIYDKYKGNDIGDNYDFWLSIFVGILWIIYAAYDLFDHSIFKESSGLKFSKNHIYH